MNDEFGLNRLSAQRTFSTSKMRVKWKDDQEVSIAFRLKERFQPAGERMKMLKWTDDVSIAFRLKERFQQIARYGDNGDAVVMVSIAFRLKKRFQLYHI